MRTDTIPSERHRVSGGRQRLQRGWISHLWWLLKPPSPLITSWGSPTISEHWTDCPRCFLDGSWIDQQMSEIPSKIPCEILAQIAFEYLRSSPKSARRLPTITANVKCWSTHVRTYNKYQKNVNESMNTSQLSLYHSWIIDKYLWIIYGNFEKPSVSPQKIGIILFEMQNIKNMETQKARAGKW